MATIIAVVFNPQAPSLYNHPLFVFQHELRSFGYDIHFFDNLSDRRILDSNTLIFHDRNYRDFLPITQKDRTSATNFLSAFFLKFEHVIWFDNMDSTGWLRNYVFPMVDKYVKGQILQNQYLYQKQPTGDLHREFAIQRSKVNENRNIRDPLTALETTKIFIGWNMAFRNWYSVRFSFLYNIQTKLRISGYKLPFVTPNLAKRGNTIPYRASYWDNIPSVAWWRKQTKSSIDEFLITHHDFTTNSINRVNRLAYYNELRNAIVTISPFGIGEICYRDFEAFFCGSLLLKPNMDHLKTWPDLYIDGETYISHKWDFSDFDEKLEDILTHPDRYEQIAREGQNRFRSALNDGQAFARHFHEMVSFE